MSYKDRFKSAKDAFADGKYLFPSYHHDHLKELPPKSRIAERIDYFRLESEMEPEESGVLAARYCAASYLLRCLNEIYDPTPCYSEDESENPEPMMQEQILEWERYLQETLVEVGNWGPDPSTLTDSERLDWELDMACATMNVERLSAVRRRMQELVLLEPGTEDLIEGLLAAHAAISALGSPNLIMGPANCIRSMVKCFGCTFGEAVLLTLSMMPIALESSKLWAGSLASEIAIGLLRSAKTLLEADKYKFPVEIERKNFRDVRPIYHGALLLVLGHPELAAVKWETALYPTAKQSLLDEERLREESALLRTIARAWERAGQLQRAIQRLAEANELFADPSDYLRFARLHREHNADIRRAYEVLRKDPAFSERVEADPYLSAMKAIVDIAGLPAIDEFYRNQERRDPVQYGMNVIKATLRAPCEWVSDLQPDTLTEFTKALYYAYVDELGPEVMRAERAINCASKAAEIELLRHVLYPFKETCADSDKKSIESNSDKRLSELKDLLLGKKVTLGAGLQVVRLTGSIPVTQKLEQFVAKKCDPSIKNAEFLRIVRNRADEQHHVDPDDGSIKPPFMVETAREHIDLCLRFLRALHKASPSSPGQGASARPGKPIGKGKEGQ